MKINIRLKFRDIFCTIQVVTAENIFIFLYLVVEIWQHCFGINFNNITIQTNSRGFE